MLETSAHGADNEQRLCRRAQRPRRAVSHGSFSVRFDTECVSEAESQSVDARKNANLA